MLPEAAHSAVGRPHHNGWRPVHQVIGISLGLVTAAYYAALMSVPTNDNFMHMALARQVLAGDVPVRDFFDSGVGLMYALSAAAERVLGYRLLGEAVIVGAAAGISVFLTFRLVTRLSGSTLAATLAGLLVLVAAPRGYSYPKLIVYAGAATLWWRYVWRPGPLRAAALGAWAAASFYWRPDHGLYVAAGALLAVLAADGISRTAAQRASVAGLVALALTAPFFAFVYAVAGLPAYVVAGVTQAEAEHVSANGSHSWPAWPLRGISDVIRFDSADAYAPQVTFRWSASSSPSARAALLARYGLTSLGADGPLTERVRLTAAGVAGLRALIADPIIEDTAGIERGAARLPWSTWTPWQRWRFEHRWLRVRLYSGVDEHTAASQAAAMLFYLMPSLVIAAAVMLARRAAAPRRTGWHWLAFGVFCAVVNLGLLRAPYEVRAVDGVVPAAILFGCGVAAAWRFAWEHHRISRWGTIVFLVAASLLMVKSVATAGEFGSRAAWLAGDWSSPRRMRGAWHEVYERLVTSPPIDYWEAHAAQARPVPGTLQLARYVHACVPSAERTLVLWFAPEIYYYADRPAAARHFVFVRGWGALPSEQEAALRRVLQFSPPLVLATDGIDGLPRATLPGVVDFVHRAYDVAGSLDADGDRFLVLARRGRPVTRTYGDAAWPCYT